MSPEVRRDLHFNLTQAESRQHTGSPAPPGWLLFLIPSVGDLLFLAILFLLSTGVLSQKLLGDAGTGWHIRAGEQIITMHAVPRSDAFSVSTAGKPWYAWEWLYDAGIAVIHHWFGLNGIVVLTAFVIAVTFALTLPFSMRRGAGLPVALFLVLLAAAASTIHFLARPHVVTWLLLVIWFEVVDSSETSADPRRLYWLSFITLFWVNVHGGFLLGFVLCALFFLGKALEYWRMPESRNNIMQWMKALATSSALSLLVTLVNPYGYNLHLHIYRYLTDRFLMNHVEEFQSPNFHGLAQQCFAALVLVTIATLAIATRKLRTSHLLIAVFAVYSGMYASRNLPASSILLGLIIAPVLSTSIREFAERATLLRGTWRWFLSFSHRMTTMEFRLRGHLWPMLGTALLCVICFNHGSAGSMQLLDAQFSGKRFPVQAVGYVEQHHPGMPIFAPDYWGGYLIYRLYPREKVFADDRHDLYGDAFLRRYLGVIHVVPGWQKVLGDWQVNLVVLPAESSQLNILQGTHQWQEKYGDETATGFRRITAPQEK